MTEDEIERWRARQDEKAAKQRYFSGLERTAFEVRVNPKKAKKVRQRAEPKPRQRVTVSPARRLTPPTHCITCGRKMRRSHEELTPDTIRYGGLGKCSTCYSKPYAKARVKPPANCTVCDRPMRYTGQRLEDHPGTVKHVGNGMCGKCTNRAGRTDVVEHTKPPEHCLDCGKKMRTSSQLLADFPGTVAHRGQGVCDGCTKARKRAGTWVPKAMVR